MRAEGSDQCLNPPTGIANKSALGGGGCIMGLYGDILGWGGCIISSTVTTAERGGEPSGDTEPPEQLTVMVKDIFQKYWKYFWRVVGVGIHFVLPATIVGSLNRSLLTGIRFLWSLFPNVEPNVTNWTFWRSLWLFELPALWRRFKPKMSLSQHTAWQWIGSWVWKGSFPATAISTCQHRLACKRTTRCQCTYRTEWWFDRFWRVIYLTPVCVSAPLL